MRDKKGWVLKSKKKDMKNKRKKRKERKERKDRKEKKKTNKERKRKKDKKRRDRESCRSVGTCNLHPLSQCSVVLVLGVADGMLRAEHNSKFQAASPLFLLLSSVQSLFSL